jgi:hypothetical protein
VPLSEATHGAGSNDDEPLPDAAALAEALAVFGVDFVRHERNACLVTLPGERRHRTMVWLVLGRHELLTESFVCRAPDENKEEVYGYLLKRNAQLRSVAYTLDVYGDIHLTGRVGRRGVTTREVDQILGDVLAASDTDFNPILERGFATSIRREWAWRENTGQSVHHLMAFRRVVDKGAATP